jgi:hypothetical protein
MSDYLFEDVRIENAPWCLVNLVMEKTEFSARQEGFGSISKLRFRNITVASPQKLPSTIQGADPDHRISDVVFENFRIGGKPIRAAAEGRFEIDPATTRDIRFGVRAGP